MSGRRAGRPARVTRLEWDHAVPFAYLQANPDWNWLPACDVCNGIKGSEMLADRDAAVAYVCDQWEARDYSVVWVPPVSSEADPERWAAAYAAYLARSVWGQGTDV